MLLLLSAYIAAVTLGLFSKSGSRTATALILLGNWVANSALVYFGGDAFPWPLFAVTDYLTAVLIALVAMERWQMAVAAIYAAQLVTHAGYGLSAQGAVQQYQYWYALYYLAWAQVAIFFGWWGYERLRRWHGARRSMAHPAPRPSAAKEAQR